MAQPEIFKKAGHGKPVDIWAIGVISYFLLCGYTPFDRDSQYEEMQAICNGDYKFEPVSLALLYSAEQLGRVLGGCFGHCQAICQVLLDYRPIQPTYLGSAIEPLVA